MRPPVSCFVELLVTTGFVFRAIRTYSTVPGSSVVSRAAFALLPTRCSFMKPLPTALREPPAGAEPFEDGFQPHSCPRPTLLLRQPQLHDLPPGLTVLPKAVSEATAREAYDFTVARARDDAQWGTYLTLQGEDEATGELRLSLKGAEPEVEELARKLLQEFWRNAAPYIRRDLCHVHGFGVWAVIGGVGLETSYHIDYAEIYRHQTNCIVPPLHAATIQVAPVEPEGVEGGTFGAHRDGLEHYRRHGYKGRYDDDDNDDDDKPTSDWGTSEGWMYAPYTFRQATLHSGELPHACDRVKRWPEGMRRVVIGINSFGMIEGPTELATPQHSHAFKVQFKLAQLIKKVGPEGVAQMLIEQKRKRNTLKSLPGNEARREERRLDEGRQ